MNLDDESVTIPTDANPITIKNILSEFHSSEIDKATSMHQLHAGCFTDVETKLEKTDESILERDRITSKHVDSSTKKAQELEEVNSRLQISRDKGQLLHSNREELLTEYRSRKRELDIAVRNLTKIRDVGGDFGTIAAVLATVTCFVDKTEPILWTPRRFVWVTVQIFMRDADTTVLSTNFGRFKIDIKTVDGRLIPAMVPLEPNYRRQYPHPHINSENGPCLGNAASMLLQCLKQGDIGTAISVTHEFLTSYNPESPYHELDNWEECRYYSAMCDCGLTLASKCGCDRCLCGENLEIPIGGQQYLNPPECGFCGSCCDQYHKRSEEILAAGIGINGSSCLSTDTPELPAAMELTESQP